MKRNPQTATGGEAKIQRLMMTEAYLGEYAYAHLKMGKDRVWDGSGEKREIVEQIFKQPFWQKLVNSVRIYDMYQRKLFVRRDLSVLRDNLKSIRTYATQLDAYVYRNRREINDTDVSRMATNALDDAKQEEEALQAVASDRDIPDGGVTFQQALFFARAGVRYRDVLKDSNLAPGVDGGEAGSPRNFTGGNVSTVTGLTYQMENGLRQQKVFKPNEQIPSVPDDGAKIDFLNAQTAIRALATSRVQELIRTKMTEAGRQFENVITSISLAMYKGEVGTSASMASGTEVTTSEKNERGILTGMTDLNVDISSIKVQRQLANLQLFDMLTGQSDRNPGNIMISQKRGEEATVTGIDQDFSFSEHTDITKTIGKTGMPQLIDRYFAEAILAIGAGEYKGALKGLPKTSFDAAMTRFDVIKQHLREKANANQLIVAPGDNTYPNARTWGDIQPGEYRYSSFGAATTDYAGRIVKNVTAAYDACVKNRDLKPKQVQKGNKQVWVLEYTHGGALQARNDDGSDLFELVNRAKDERLSKAGYGYKGNNNGPRTNFRIGVRNKK